MDRQLSECSCIGFDEFLVVNDSILAVILMTFMGYTACATRLSKELPDSRKGLYMLLELLGLPFCRTPYLCVNVSIRVSP